MRVIDEGELKNALIKIKNRDIKIEKLVMALKNAKQTIRTWHTIDVKDPAVEERAWELYQLSPEMKIINESLSEAESDPIK